MVSASHPRLQKKQKKTSNQQSSSSHLKKKKRQERTKGGLTINIHTIPPPIQTNPSPLRELQRKKNRNQTQHSPTIQRRTRHIIKFTPPLQIPPPNQILEYKSHKEPTAVVDPDCRRDKGYPVQNDRRTDVS